MERPTDLLARAEVWSNYKHHSTIKFLIKTHGSVSRGQEQQPVQRLPRIYYTRRDCVQKTYGKTNLYTTRIPHINFKSFH